MYRLSTYLLTCMMRISLYYTSCVHQSIFATRTNICVWLKVPNFIFSTVGIGPRLTSLLVEITESGDLKTEDIVRFVTLELLWLIHTELERDREKIACKIIYVSFHTTTSAVPVLVPILWHYIGPSPGHVKFCLNKGLFIWCDCNCDIFVACNGSHGTQCKRSHGTIMTMTLKPHTTHYTQSCEQPLSHVLYSE